MKVEVEVELGGEGGVMKGFVGKMDGYFRGWEDISGGGGRERKGVEEGKKAVFRRGCCLRGMW